MAEVIKFQDLFKKNEDGKTYTPFKDITFQKWPFNSAMSLKQGLNVDENLVSVFIGHDLLVEVLEEGSVEIKGIC